MDKTIEVKEQKESEEIKIDSPKVECEVYRDNMKGKTYFKFQVSPEIEELFKGLQHEVKESQSWKGLKFYYIPSLTGNTDYKENLAHYRLFDDYGTGLVKDGLFNIAWLRTIGGKGEILVKDPLSHSEFSLLFGNAHTFIREHLEESFKPFRIKMTLSVQF